MAESNQPDTGENRNATMLGVRALNGIVTALGKIFPSINGTSSTASSGAATLPGNPLGFIDITLPDGSAAKVPYYDV